MYSGLDELWIISGIWDSINVTPVHTIVNNMDNSVVDVLPAVYVLTGCGTTGKVDTKSAAFQTAVKCGYKLLHSFGKSEIFD